MRDYKQLTRLVAGSRKTLILGHHNADPDAVCSAIALRGLLKSINRRQSVSLAFPEGPSKVSEGILRNLAVQYEASPDFGGFDVFVTVDTNTLEQLGNWATEVRQSVKPLVVIDHHAVHPDTEKAAASLLCDEEATSTCEIIIDMYRKHKRALGKQEGIALFAGIVFETGHLSIGTKRTFENICWLIARGVDPVKAQSILKAVMDESERIARLKAAQRLGFEKAGKWLIAKSEVGSFQASAARALISLGAQAVVAGGDHQGKASLSYRSTREFYEGTGIHLGTDVARIIGERFGGAGGGHATAAGANITADVGPALKESLQLIRELIEHPVKA